MKVAVFHSFLDNIGGAEIVALTTARALDADVFTTNLDSSKISKMGFSDLLCRITSIGKIPIQAPFKQQMALWKFQNLKLPEHYDFYIIMDDWSISATNHHSPCLWYIHAPFNELWEYKDFIKKEMLSSWQRPLFEGWVQVNRRVTKRFITKNSLFVCNSNNSQHRSKQFLNLNPTIIHPPIDTSRYHFSPNENFWLSVNRLTRAKRIEIQIEAFRKLPDENLLIVGSYEEGANHFEAYVKELKASLPHNVQILSWLNYDKLQSLYSSCKGLIATAFDEDFGLSVLEAMASGKPVIAANSGGYRETILHHKTGVLLDNIGPDNLADTVTALSFELLNRPELFKEACIKRASEFGLDVFVGKMKKELLSLM